MPLSAGIIGLPNVGKSTLFNALCSAHAAMENYPFCTIDPNRGMTAVPDDRLGRIASVITTAKIVPAFLELIDIAGLVKGASHGEGLGNQFLGHIKDVDAVVHVVRCFEDPDVVHVDGSIDPLRDAATVETEILLKDLDTATSGVDRIAKAAKSGDKELKARLEIYERVQSGLERGIPARESAAGEGELGEIAAMHLISAKPILYVGNVAEADLSPASESPHVESLREFAADRGIPFVPICARIEAELNDLPEDERGEFLASLGLAESGLARLSREVYALLGLESFFTWNEKELHARTLPVGSTAPQAAGTIHSDFEKGFVRADVYSVGDLEEFRTEPAMRAAGKIRSEGRDYVVKDGEILFFKFTP
jgi:hypothetical protein